MTKPVAASSIHSGGTRTTAHSSASASARTRDANLIALARETKRRIKWDRILRDTAREWKWRENSHAFSIYTKQTPADPNGNHSTGSTTYGVLAIGVVKGTVKELASLLVARSQVEYEQIMKAIHTKDFKHGKYISDAVQDPQLNGEAEGGGSDGGVALSVRSATFATHGWLQRDDAWCYLDATRYDKETEVLEKLLTTLQQHPYEKQYPNSGGTSSSSLRDAKQVKDVVCGYHMKQETHAFQTETCPNKLPVASVKVHFYGEISSKNSHANNSPFAMQPHNTAANKKNKNKKQPSTQATKDRLIQIAKNCDRFSVLVRRRRLGMQVLVDRHRISLPSSNSGSSSSSSHCFMCDKSQLIGKLCKVCGHKVCRDCSAKYEREIRTRRGSLRTERVRVCDPCLARVESADYSNIQGASLIGPAIVPDRKRADRAEQADRADSPEQESSTSSDLKSLLRDALLDAPSPKRKASVMSVIRCVLDQERAGELKSPQLPVRVTTTSEPHDNQLTPFSGQSEYVKALDYLDVPETNKPAPETRLSCADGRSYVIDPRAPLNEPMACSTPTNEAKRLHLIETSGILTHNDNGSGGPWDELNIICEIAAKELGVFASMITILTESEQIVIAASMPQFENVRLQRHGSFCQHSLMETKPLIIPHPEADVRFSRIPAVTNMGIRYYCGFPLILDDHEDTVFGTLCCVDTVTHQVTESQFDALLKLSQTAAKIVRLQGESRRRRGSAWPVEVDV